MNGDVMIVNIPLVEDIATRLAQWQRKVTDDRFSQFLKRATTAKDGTYARCVDGLHAKGKDAA